jgi:hypothetical protein
MEQSIARDEGTMVLSGIAIDIVLDSVEFVIEEFIKSISHAIPCGYKINDISWGV